METDFSITADNVYVIPGDVVFIRKSDGFERKIVGRCFARKIEYTEPDSEGYIGARLNLVYWDKPEE